MPGIKLADTAAAKKKPSPIVRLKRLSLAVLVLFVAHPAFAADSGTSVQPMTWGEDPASEAAPGETAPEASQDDVWQRIRNGFKLDDAAAENPLVAVHESWYAARPDYVRRMLERSRRYLFHIVEEIDRRGMPMEIALLPMIESAFNSTALSPAAASGIWQFMPATARLYGLKQDNWYDGRRDFTAATSAALDYLDKLYLDFGDWQLALAAYNCGEGCVARAIEKNVQQGLPTDYASLPLPNETRHYVPKLLAIRNLVRNPEQFGVAIDTLPNQPYFEKVTVRANMDIQSAARLANMSKDEFLALNAAFPRKLIRSDTPVDLLVPADKADTFQRNLESGTWDSWKPYSAKKGERPEAIAKRFDVSVARLEEHNQFVLKRGKLARAQTVLVPVKGGGTADTPNAVAQDDAPAPAALPARHQVQRGETLYGVARRYGVSVAELKQANPGLGSAVKVGQSLRLPAGTQAGEAPTALRQASVKAPAKKTSKPLRYTVKRGDTLHAIADRFDTSLANLKAWNPAVKKRGSIRAGQTILVQNP